MNSYQKEELLCINKIEELISIVFSKFENILYSENALEDVNLVYLVNFCNRVNPKKISKWFATFNDNKVKLNTLIKNFYTIKGEDEEFLWKYMFDFDDINAYIDQEEMEVYIREKLVGTDVEASIGEALFLMKNKVRLREMNKERIINFCIEHKIKLSNDDNIVPIY